MIKEPWVATMLPCSMCGARRCAQLVTHPQAIALMSDDLSLIPGVLLCRIYRKSQVLRSRGRAFMRNGSQKCAQSPRYQSIEGAHLEGGGKKKEQKTLYMWSCKHQDLAFFIWPSTWSFELRPYTSKTTASRPICAVKHLMAESVLWWGTTWEYSVL
jgi:hypothetical protein